MPFDPQPISLLTLERDVRKVAAARPERIYPKRVSADGAACLYNADADGEGIDHACLIGAGVAVQVPFNGEWELYHGDVTDLLTDEFDETVNEYISRRFIIIDEDGADSEDIFRWLLKVQVTQDDGKDWATAVRLADEARTNGWRDEDDAPFNK